MFKFGCIIRNDSEHVSRVTSNSHVTNHRLSVFCSAQWDYIVHVCSVWTCVYFVLLLWMHPILLDVEHSFRFSKNKKVVAWNKIQDKLKWNVKTVNKKMTSILGTFGVTAEKLYSFSTSFWTRYIYLVV